MSKILAVILLAVMSVTMIKTAPIPERSGELMSLQDFVESCLMHAFIDYDGYGYYVRDGMMHNFVLPSHIMKGNVDISFSEVIWFNR